MIRPKAILLPVMAGAFLLISSAMANRGQEAVRLLDAGKGEDLKELFDSLPEGSDERAATIRVLRGYVSLRTTSPELADVPAIERSADALDLIFPNSVEVRTLRKFAADMRPRFEEMEALEKLEAAGDTPGLEVLRQVMGADLVGHVMRLFAEQPAEVRESPEGKAFAAELEQARQRWLAKARGPSGIRYVYPGGFSHHMHVRGTGEPTGLMVLASREQAARILPLPPGTVWSELPMSVGRRSLESSLADSMRRFPHAAPRAVAVLPPTTAPSVAPEDPSLIAVISVGNPSTLHALVDGEWTEIAKGEVAELMQKVME